MRTIKDSFNPYFTGSLTATEMTFEISWPPNPVSILILLEVLLQLDVSSKHSYFCISSVFQSLFYWKSYCNIWICYILSCSKQVSILILLEVLLQLTTGVPKALEVVGFNPYFTGSLTATFQSVLLPQRQF